MITLGLTGGIGSGKSTVARLLTEHGAEVCDADALAHQLLAPDQPGHDPVVEAFGEGILDGEGRIDRRRLGTLVFDDPTARRRLEAITHPLIGAGIAAATAQARAAGAPVFVVEAALLVETGLNRAFDVLAVVRLDAGLARERVAARDGLDVGAVAARQRAQTDDATRCAQADHVIENSGSREELAAQVAAIWESLTAAGGGPADLTG